MPRRSRARATRHGQAEFYRLLSTPARLFLFAAVFMTFAPVGLLSTSRLTPDRSLIAILAVALVSGAIATSWAAVAILDRRFIISAVIATVLLALLSSPAMGRAIGNDSVSPDWLSIAIIAAIVSGYVLFIVFIGGQGRQVLRLQGEMALARSIHEALVPTIDHRGEHVEVLAISVASAEMGGDLVDLVDLGDGRVDAILADVSGHGVRAGVVMGMVKAALRTRWRAGDAPEATARSVNVMLEELTPSDVFATGALVRSSDGGARLDVVLAGHHPVVVARGIGGVELVENEALPLGVVADERFVERTVTLGPGDLVAIYTDGFDETTASDGGQLGHDAVRRAIAARVSRPLTEIAAGAFETAEAHGVQVDDRSIMLLRRLPIT